MAAKLFKRTYFLFLIAALFIASAGSSLLMLHKSQSLLAWNERATGWALVQLVLLQQTYVSTLIHYQHGENVYEELLEAYDLTWAAYQTLIEGRDEHHFIGVDNRLETLKLHFKAFEAEDPLNVVVSESSLVISLENNRRAHDYAMKLLNLEFQGLSAQRHERDFALYQLNKVIVLCLLVLCLSGSIFLFVIMRDRRKMVYMAYHDTLTKLNNRGALQEKITQLHDDKIRFCTLLMDIDGFKLVNDKYGHDVGDQLLIHISEKMQALCQPPNFVGRLGGDEFALVCFTQKALDEIVEKLLAITNNAIIIDGCCCDVGLSIGISYSRTHHETWIEVLKNADQAMYQAKEKGGNQAQIYDPD